MLIWRDHRTFHIEFTIGLQYPKPSLKMKTISNLVVHQLNVRLLFRMYWRPYSTYKQYLRVSNFFDGLITQRLASLKERRRQCHQMGHIITPPQRTCLSHDIPCPLSSQSYMSGSGSVRRFTIPTETLANKSELIPAFLNTVGEK